MVDFDEIVVPVDGSDGSSRAAAFAARLASSLQVPVRLLYVFPSTAFSTVGFARMSAEEIDTAKKSAAREILERARAAVGAAPAGIDEQVLMGDPAEEIVGYVGQHPRSLVVMGRRGLSPMKALMIGSVSEKVARHAQGAVTLVN